MKPSLGHHFRLISHLFQLVGLIATTFFHKDQSLSFKLDTVSYRS